MSKAWGSSETGWARLARGAESVAPMDAAPATTRTAESRARPRREDRKDGMEGNPEGGERTGKSSVANQVNKASATLLRLFAHTRGMEAAAMDYHSAGNDRRRRTADRP